jgi:hypothetical protein
MIAGRKIVCLIACIQLAANVELRGNDSIDGHWRCPPTDDGACIPNPKSYGYYPTRWRKWPGSNPGAEVKETPKAAESATSTTKQAPPTGTEELPPGENPPPSGMGDELPDLMPSEPSRSTKPELAPEVQGDLPQPPDLESLLPEEGPDEVPSPPPTKSQPPKTAPPKTAPPKTPTPAARPESKIPKDEDPFGDDLLPSEDMGGAAHSHAPAASNVTVKTPAPPKPKTNPVRPTPPKDVAIPSPIKPAIVAPVAPIEPPATNKTLSPPELKTIPENEDPFRDDPLVPDGDQGASVGPPVPPPAATAGKMHWRPDPRLKQPVRVAEKKNPIVLADAQNVRQPSARPVAFTATSGKAAPSHTNPLRSATSGMVLPGPMAEPDEVVPAAAWSPEGAAIQAQPAIAEAPAASAPASNAVDPGASTVRRINPLRASR